MTQSTESPETDRCMNCRCEKRAHIQTGHGLQCPERKYFVPCQHQRTHGRGMISSDGTSSGENYCLDCGKVFPW